MTHAEEKLVADYERQGFYRVVVRRDEPNFSYQIHFHEYGLMHHVVEGSLTIVVNHQATVLGPGQSAFVPAHMMHSVVIGPAGCTYIHAEKKPK